MISISSVNFHRISTSQSMRIVDVRAVRELKDRSHPFDITEKHNLKKENMVVVYSIFLATQIRKFRSRYVHDFPRVAQLTSIKAVMVNFICQCDGT